VFSGKPSAINVACSVWEEGNEKGLEGTSSVPYFIWREGKAARPYLSLLSAKIYHKLAL